ncbi:MAG: carboxypeptidase-like regulatory domain-containing protein [Bacteroidetes bacterium]|nr:MAG: carboxypeptidase-like regulatory domain-containing protein [Bacteroidota bacterium]
MKNYRSLLILSAFFISETTFGQFTLTGKVVDSASREPLYGASVFCQNTTSGTITNKEGGFSLQLKAGGYELIISFTGYQTREIRISNNDNSPLQIELVKEEKTMGEVVIRSSNEVTDGWNKYGKFFLENFIGSTPNSVLCTLQNPEVLHFYYYKKSDKLKVLATEPVLISNKALGYTLRYQLDSFMYYYKTQISSYRGYCFFTQMEGSFQDQKAWSENRKKVYYGSKLQFMRSYYDSTLREDGYEIGLLDENNKTKFNVVQNPYDSAYYTIYDSTYESEVYYPRKISVSYKKKPEPEYIQRFKLPKNVGAEISYIDLIDAIVIKENGYFYDQKDWINQGYWSWKNLADLLPYDYIP